MKLTFVPDVRVRCWLRSVRFTWRSFAGTVRTLVAVGTPSDASMLAAIRREAPDRTTALCPVSETELTAGTPGGAGTTPETAADGSLGGAGAGAVVGIAPATAPFTGAAVAAALAGAAVAAALAGAAVAAALAGAAVAAALAGAAVAAALAGAAVAAALAGAAVAAPFAGAAVAATFTAPASPPCPPGT